MTTTNPTSTDAPANVRDEIAASVREDASNSIMLTSADSSNVTTSAADAASDATETATKDEAVTNHQEIVYHARKPKWWYQLGNNHRNASKSQKKAMRRVLDGIEPEGSGINSNNSNDDNSSSSSNNNNSKDALPLSKPLGGIRLPAVPYGSTLDWDEAYPPRDAHADAGAGAGVDTQQQREIWLELGFGRGENLQALVETKRIREEEEEEESVAAADRQGDPSTKRLFCLVGAEISGVGIGCLCKRIDELGKDEDKDKDIAATVAERNDYVLYRPELDPYAESPGSESASASGSASASSTGQKNSNSNSNCNCNNPPGRDLDSLSQYYRDRLRIYTGDGYKLLPRLPDETLSAILVTFPDPFPKQSDVRYRLVQKQTLVECHRLLRRTNGPGGDQNHQPGRLFLATDHDGYHEWCHTVMAEFNHQQYYDDDEDDNNDDDDENNGGNHDDKRVAFRLVEPCPDRSEWLPAISRYEQKGWDEGRTTKLSCWEAI